MKHISEALVEVVDQLLDRQPAQERAHCVQRQADLVAGMDDMAEWAQTHPVVTRIGTGEAA